MNFVSVEFLVFFPVVMLLFNFLPSKYRWCVLLISSYFFYFYWNPWTILLLLTTTLVSYVSAISIEKAKSKKEEKFWLVLTLIVSLGFLVVFKYLSFFLNSFIDLANLFGVEKESYVLNIFLPLGISFYTFQTLSYVLDVYKKDIKPEKHFGYYALFVSYFPQLVAGPIERPSNLLPQLKEEKIVSAEDITLGLQILLRGFLKKLLIADFLGSYVDLVYKNPMDYSGLVIIIATVMFAFQIYCDFSGYSDIAVGMARMMGIKLIKNFDRPYSATNIQDFWRRWHISLTSWFTDYVYKPLGGSRRGFARQCFNVMLVFVISGLWHGAAWNYILWGCLHGFYMVINIVLRKFRNVEVNNKSFFSTKIKQIRTFGLVCFGWIYFRAETINDANILVLNLFSGWTFDRILSDIRLLELDIVTFIYIVLAGMCVSKLEAVDFSQSRDTRVFLIVFLLINIVAFGWLSLLSLNGSSTFIYFQF